VKGFVMKTVKLVVFVMLALGSSMCRAEDVPATDMPKAEAPVAEAPVETPKAPETEAKPAEEQTEAQNDEKFDEKEFAEFMSKIMAQNDAQDSQNTQK
jgi:hypothetical protein